MAVDETMRKLQFPPRFLPYLEKHKVYEMFYDLGNELAISQPKDPLVFIKYFLLNLNKTKHRRLVMLMTPPYLDRIKLAQLLSIKVGYGIISRYIINSTPGDFYDPHALAENTAKYTKESDREGWILADYPDTEEEAKLLIKTGSIPTHTFLLLPEGVEDPALSCYGEPEAKREPSKNFRSVSITPSILLEYENSLPRLLDLFKSSLKIVKIGDKSLEDLAEACTHLTLKEPSLKIPKLFRIALVGPRGSRRKTVAKILQNKYNLVQVDMHKLIQVARIREDDMGDLLRNYDKYNIVYPIKVVFGLLTSRIYQNDCLTRGYVLTNFPTSVEDFVVLDSSETPPNRVIFFKTDKHMCLERLTNRVVNIWTGKLYPKKEINNKNTMKTQVLPHPDDEPYKIEEELKFYYEREDNMIKYCGSKGIVINAKGSLKEILERVESVLMKPSLQIKPRTKDLPSKKTYQEHGSNSRSNISTPDTRKHYSYPMSRTEVVPLIDSEDLMKRYFDLKNGREDKLERIETKIDHANVSSISLSSLKLEQPNNLDTVKLNSPKNSFDPSYLL